MRQGSRLRHLVSEKTLLAGLMLLIAIGLATSDILWRWDRIFYDAHLALWSRSAPSDVVIVAIDEQSLDSLGRWPWPRRVHADLIERLSAAGAKAIALDVIFAEPDAANPGNDQALARAIRANGRVVLPVLPEQFAGQLVETLPIPMLTEAAAGLGHVEVVLDQDSVARRIFLKAGLGSPRWPAFALALLELADPAKAAKLPGVRSAPAAQPLPSEWLRDHEMLLPYAGAPGRFARMSYAAVLSPDFDARAVRDKFVLVGVTAAGLSDLFPTPVSIQGNTMPGVELHANVFDALRRGAVLEPLGERWRLALTVLLALMPALFYTLLPVRWSLPITILWMALTALVSVLLARTFHVWLGPAPALLTQALSLPLWSWRQLEQTIRSLFRERQQALVTLRAIGDAVISTDPNGAVKYLNPSAEQLIGASLAKARDLPLADVFQNAGAQGYEALVHLVNQALHRNETVALDHDLPLRYAGRDERALRGSAAPIRNQQGQARGAVLAISDVTETRRMERQLAFQADHDLLTGLPNRNLFEKLLQQALSGARRNNTTLAVVFLDLDRFKTINDGLGHTAGDELLKAVAMRLADSANPWSTAARLGGDEFALLIDNLAQQEAAAALAERALQILKPPVAVQGQEIVVSASLGVSLFPKDGDDAETLLRNAHTAMYRAKNQGRDGYQFFSADMNDLARKRLSLEQSLRRAIERGELELYYQPQMDSKSSLIVGAETLLRWRQPERGMVSPGEFIPLAEETGLIIPIGEWAIRAACDQIKIWQAQGLATPRIAINLSPRQFLQRDVAQLVERLLADTHLAPHFIELEITESLLMNDVREAIATLHKLKAMGVELAMDDFGTGYSNFSYLKQFPIDYLKVDQSFVRGLPAAADAAVAQAMITMAHGLKLKVIAEGVETEAQYGFLAASGCDLLQGYYVSRPLAASDMTTLLRNPPRAERL
ncbi:MAG: EAL domain-containing protein [Gammaproteobacteria bacterium]